MNPIVVDVVPSCTTGIHVAVPMFCLSVGFGLCTFCVFLQGCFCVVLRCLPCIPLRSRSLDIWMCVSPSFFLCSFFLWHRVPSNVVCSVSHFPLLTLRRACWRVCRPVHRMHLMRPSSRWLTCSTSMFVMSVLRTS